MRCPQLRHRPVLAQAGLRQGSAVAAAGFGSVYSWDIGTEASEHSQGRLFRHNQDDQKQ